MVDEVVVMVLVVVAVVEVLVFPGQLFTSPLITPARFLRPESELLQLHKKCILFRLEVFVMYVKNLAAG